MTACGTGGVGGSVGDVGVGDVGGVGVGVGDVGYGGGGVEGDIPTFLLRCLSS